MFNIKSFLAGLFLVALPAVAGAQCELQVDSFLVNNYFTSARWPGVVTASGPRPFAANILPEYYSSFDDFTATIDNGDLSKWNFSQRMESGGCYHATWSNAAIDDAPFTPLWCAGGWAQFCGSRTGEQALVEVYDIDGNEAWMIGNCVQTSRGSTCKF